MRSTVTVLLALAACNGPSGSDAPDAAIIVDAASGNDGSMGGDDASTPVDAPIDAMADAPPQDPTWSAVASTCKTLRDVAWLGESEVFLACGMQGVLRVTATGVQSWTVPAGAVSKVASAGGETRLLACNTVYRFEGAGWIEEAVVGTLSSCSMGFAGGDGGWFVGTRSFGGNGGFWMRDATGTWVVGADTVRGFEDFIVLGPTEFVANTIGVSTGINHMRKPTNYWSSASDFSFAVLGMWRATTEKIYFIAGHGNGPNGGKGGVYRWVADQYTWEWDTAGLEWLTEVWGRSATEIYAAGDEGVLARSIGDGTWTQISSGTDIDIEHIWSWNGHLVVANDESPVTIHVVP